MPVKVSGFAQGLVRCAELEGISPDLLDAVIEESQLTLAMTYVTTAADAALLASGSPFSHLVFVQQGSLLAWQSPRSELAAPFLVGVHEFLIDAERWVGSYSALPGTVVVRIPKSVMSRVVERFEPVRARMHELVMRRLARFYWVSLATSGAPASRVAAALVSRLALDDLDHGTSRRIMVRQKDIGRLTTMSRSAVAAGLAELAEARVIGWGDGPGARFAGEIVVPDVDLLKQLAFRDLRERELMPLRTLAEQD